MRASQTWTALVIVILVSAAVAAQGRALRASDAAAFVGTWAVTMTEPEELKGSQQTVRIWEQDGLLAASLQVGKFPPTSVTGIFRDGDILVLTITHNAPRPILENGVPIWAVIALTVDGDTMRMAQTLERSRTIKRGAGKKVAPAAFGALSPHGVRDECHCSTSGLVQRRIPGGGRPPFA